MIIENVQFLVKIKSSCSFKIDVFGTIVLWYLRIKTVKCSISLLLIELVCTDVND